MSALLALLLFGVMSLFSPTAYGAYGVKSFDGSVTADSSGSASYTQAGGHPYAVSTSIAIETRDDPLYGPIWPAEPIKDALVDVPPGLVGNPTVVAQCSLDQLTNQRGQLCPPSAQVGTATIVHVFCVPGFCIPLTATVPLFNMTPPPDVPARFAFITSGTVVTFRATLRSGSDYGLSVEAPDVSEGLPVIATSVSFWGVPADPAHTPERACPGTPVAPAQGGPSCAAGVAPKPFLRLPTACLGPQMTTLRSDSWFHPGDFVTASFLSHQTPAEGGAPEGVTGCDHVPFEPTVEVTPTATQADSPTGLNVDLTVPQNALEEPEATSQADVRKIAVTLPDGMTVNPAVANGLSACSSAQMDLHGEGTEPECPESSKLGNVTIDTPLLSGPLHGAVYQAAQNDNPFHSLLALYVVAKGSGVVVKLAGEVKLDPTTGRITTVFDDLPQTPFSHLHMELFGGSAAALIAPPTCGGHSIASTLEGWNGKVVTATSSFGVSCTAASGRFAPTVTAGATKLQAGGFSPFVLSFSRGDGEQHVRGLTETLPPGASASLAGVPRCSDSDAAAGTCPEDSRIGTVTVSSGAGPDPFSLPGKVYLTGAYRGAPFGEAVVIPVIAGPFNLGTEVIRGAIRVDSHTAQATVVSDPFPAFVKNTGIPTDVRRVDVTLDRPSFTFNPTNCTPLALTGTLTSAQNVLAAFSMPFHVANCAALPFQPRFEASTQANGRYNRGGESLTVKISTKQGPASATPEANIAKVEVQLPAAMPSRLTTLQKACTERQFAENPAGCPPESRVGSAAARTPILAAPLEGPAYLVSHGGAAFPDLVLVLQGEGIVLHLTGHTQIKKNAQGKELTYSRFETVPDAPISSFELKLPEGPYSALAMIEPACGHTVKRHGRTRHVAANLDMPTTITAQNGAVLRQTTKIKVAGCPKAVRAAHSAKTAGQRSRTHR